jgi:predicted nucleic acid-binding protein
VSVLIDTPIWSLALRRRPNAISSHENALKSELAALIQEGRATLLGPVRQELLSGIREEVQFNRIREYLQGFPDPSLHINDFEEAARCSNLCRTAGIATSQVEMLLCAAAIRRDWRVFTPDTDFMRYAKILPVRIHRPRDA